MKDSKDMCVILYLKKQNQMKQMWLKVICFPGSSAGKDSVCNVGDPGLIPGLERSPGERIGYTLQYCWASLVAQLVKNPPAIQETLV